MTTYTAGKDYPSDLPDVPESMPPKNLVAASQFTGLYTKVASGGPAGGDGIKVFGLFYDVYLNEFNPEPSTSNPNDDFPFFYRFIYWTVEGELLTRGRFRGKPGERKVGLAASQFIEGQGFNGNRVAVRDFQGRVLDPDKPGELWVTTSYGLPNVESDINGNITGTPGTFKTPSSFGWRSQETNGGWTVSGIPGTGSGLGALYNASGNQTSTPGNNEDSDKPGSGGTGDGTPPEEPELDPLPSINWFNKPTRWNPPLIGTATGAYVPVYMGDDEVDLSAPRTRDIFLGEYGIGARIRRKGYLRQYIINAEDFRVETGEVETEVENPDWDNNQAMIDLEKGWVYGFRFHYNPEQVAIGTQPILNIDPAFLTSGKEQAFPVAAEGSSVQFPIYLNRIEDVSFLRKNQYIHVRDLYKGYSKKDKKLLMGPTGTGKYLRQDIRGIRDRGTGYDLEFLYRTAMGRPFPTALRGDTADLGVILGLPMQLKLSKHINYVGRLTSLTYTHAMFSEEMVPMFTVVNLGFTRVPDAQSFGGAKE